MATYLSVPLKRTWEVDLDVPLRTFIKNTFTSANEDDYSSSLKEFNKLRNNMIAKSGDKHETALEVLYRYYDQLCAIESKLPIAENQIRINFKWQDAFDKESFFSGKRTLTIASSGFEQTAILFNIAAMQSQIATAQNITSDDGLKNAAKLFQQASGIFSYLKDIVMSVVQNDPTPDLHPDALAALSSTMLAQAQDCFCRKAMADKMKPAIIAKVAHQASDLYADAMKLLQLGSIRELWSKGDYIPSVASKQAAFHALAEYYQSVQAKDAKEFGQEIARLKHAKDLVIAAETRGGYTFIFGDYSKKIHRALEEAEKDNNLIYHSKVPELSALPGIGKASIAKTLEFTRPLSKDFSDLFEKVVPLAVYQALTAFENRKSAVVAMEIGRLREETQLLNSILASLNLPAAIEDLGGTTVPASLKEKANKVKEEGGIQELSKLMSDLPESLKRNKEILDESIKQLDEEAASDAQLKEQFKERWTRTPSANLTGPIRDEGNKYKTIISNAINADGIVQKKFNDHREGIDLLSKSDADMQKALPSGNSAAALKGSPVVKELQKLMEDVETIKAERDAMESEIKDAKCDMSSTFMAAMAADGVLNEESLSEKELDAIYGPLREQVGNSLQRQTSLLAGIEKANGEFCKAKAQNQSGVTREQKLKDLAAAYDSYMELKSNLLEGNKFYNDLTQLLVKFSSKVNDFCFARRTEKEELMKDLQTSIARQPSLPTPQAPSYQQPTTPGTPASEQPTPQLTTAGAKAPPARPPPPTRPPAPQNVQPTPATAPQGSAPPPMAQGQAAGQAPNPYVSVPQYRPQVAPPVQTAYNYQQHSMYHAAVSASIGQATPYPVSPYQYPAGGYAPPPMPQGYNPYNPYVQYGYPPQAPAGGQPPAPYPTQQYPGYPYPQQQYR